MNQYPPRQDSQDPNGQPTWPYSAPYPPPHWQPGYASPDGAPAQPQASRRRRSATPFILGVVAAVTILAVVVVLALYSFGHPNVSGTWYGGGTTGSTGTDAETFKLETFLSLTQDGTKLAGSGELCSVGTSNIPFTVSGTFTGHNLVMTWTLAGSSPGAASTSTESVTGRGTDSTLVLNSTDASGYYSSTLKHGSHAAFTSDCKSVTV